MKMKKTFLFLSLLLIMVNTGCKKEIEDAYPNPETVNPPTGNQYAGYFSSMLYQWKLFVQDYGEYWWEADLGVGMYIQTHIRYVTDRYSWYQEYDNLTDGENGNGFQGSSNGVQGQFYACYTRMKDWSTMKAGLDKMSAEEKNDSYIYYQLGTLFKDLWCLRLVDFFNKIPYSEAFKGNDAVYFPKYDDPKEIYTSVLADLKEISTTLTDNYNKMSPAAKALLVNQDFAFKGNMSKWIQFVNALRLKYAVRISGVDQALASTEIADAIKNLPTADMDFPTYATEMPPGGITWLRGVYETNYTHFIPNVIMKRMNLGGLSYEPGTDDPRLPVIAMPTKYNDYRGMSMNADTNKIDYSAGDRYYPSADNLNSALSTNTRSIYNFATYAYNAPNFPAKMITLAEIDLLLAEVTAKGITSTGKAAGDHIMDAVTHSCDYWYRINALNSSWRSDIASIHPAKNTANISTYANAVKTKFNALGNIEDKMELIMQQKYIHLNISDNYELWTELRRTRHPLLEPFQLGGKLFKPQPERVKYPTGELQTNEAEFLKVKNEDNYTSPIFWVPSGKVGSSFYGTYLGKY